MQKFKITNNAALELISNKQININKLELLASETRNGKVKVIKDKISKIIFLDKNLASMSYYKNSYKKEFKKKKFTGKYYGKKIITPRLDDNKRYISYVENFLKNKKILDFGCGDGGFLNLCKNKAKELYGIEISQQNIDFIKENYSFINIVKDIDNLNNKFDIVTLFHTYHYLDQPLRSLKKIFHSLKKKGKIIIEIPNANDLLLSKLNLESFKNFTFCKENLIWHTENSLKFGLKKVGFKKINIFFKQRYNINNHLCWILLGKPGGHKIMSQMVKSSSAKKKYEDFLIRNKISDTLVAFAEK